MLGAVSVGEDIILRASAILVALTVAGAFFTPIIRWAHRKIVETISDKSATKVLDVLMTPNGGRSLHDVAERIGGLEARFDDVLLPKQDDIFRRVKASTDTISVAAIDDDSHFRKLLARHLRNVPNVGPVELAGAISDAGDADIVLLDLKLAETDGMATIEAARQRWPFAGIVVLTGSPEGAGEAIAAGADAFLHKDVLATALADQNLDQAIKSAALARMRRT